MNCSELDQMLCPYLDGEFGPDERLELEGHLATCPACARKVHQESAFRSAFRARAREAAVVPLPEGLRDRVRTQMQAEDRRARIRAVIPYATAAALLAAAGGGYAALRTPARVPSVEEVAERFAKGQGAPAEHKFPFLRLRDARPVSAQLWNENHDAVYMTYVVERPGHAPQLIGVFVFPQREQHELAAESRKRVEVIHAPSGVNVVRWTQDGVEYRIASELADADILKMLPSEGALGVQAQTRGVPYEPASLRQ